MARELLVVWTGRHQRGSWEALCETYRRRIRRFSSIRDLPLRPRVGRDEQRRLKVEGDALLAAIPDPCWTIVLDRRGSMATSVEFARELKRLREEWPHPVAFVLGSDLGLHPEVLAAARQRLSLGPLTLPHELARLVLYEQLYRAVAMEAGINYHREPLA